MKPLAARITEYCSTVPVETSMLQVFEHILGVLRLEREATSAAILSKRRVSDPRFRRLHTALVRLSDDIEIIAALRDRHLGKARPAPRQTIPATVTAATNGGGYGEI